MKSDLLSLIWFALFAFDITYGLHTSFSFIIPIIFIVTAVLIHLNPIYRPISLLSYFIWVLVIGWLIFITLGMSVEFLSPIISQSSLYVIKPYISWVGLLSILIISVLFSLFSFVLFNKKAIYINLISGSLAGSLSLIIYGTKNSIFLVESIALVTLLFLATYVLKHLTRRSRGTNNP